MPNYRRYYIKDSIIFITVVTNQRKPILIENINILRKAITTCKYDFEILAGVVLPEHFHILLKPNNINDYTKIISSIKYYFSRNINYEKTDKTLSEIKRKEKGVWQRRYYDHIVRNEEDFYKHLDYIHYNPVKHKLAESPKDWEYSSFSKFVKLRLYENNWCNFENKHNCNSLDIE